MRNVPSGPKGRVLARAGFHLLLLSVLLCGAASSPFVNKSLKAEIKSTSESAATTAASAGSRTSKPLMAVLDFTGEDVPADELDTLCAALWERLNQRRRVTLLLRESTRIVLDQWGLTRRGALTQPNSYGRIGRALAADYLVFGQVSRFKTVYALDVSVFSVRQGATIVSETRIFEKGLPQMLAEMGAVADVLLSLRPPTAVGPSLTPIVIPAVTAAQRKTPPDIVTSTSQIVVGPTSGVWLVQTPRIRPTPTPTPIPEPTPKPTLTPKPTPSPTPKPPEPTPTPKPPEPTPLPKPTVEKVEPTSVPKPPEPTPTPKPTLTPTPKPPEPTPTPKPVSAQVEPTSPPKPTATPIAPKPTQAPPAKTPTATSGTAKVERREPIMRAKELFAQALKVGEREPEGLKLLVSVVELDPENIQYRYRLARAHFYNKDYKNAVSQCAEILKRDPRHTDALTFLGSAHFYMGDYAKAIEAHEAVLKINPRSFSAQFNLACACMHVDKTRARTELQKYLDMAAGEPSQEEYVKLAKQYLNKME